jgi:hypothetical protein
MLTTARYLPNIAVLTVLVVLGACAPTSKIIQDYDFVADITGLELDESQYPTLVYKRPGAPSLAAYSRFIIDPVQVNYVDPEMKELDPEQVGKMQEYFHNAMAMELRAGGYEVGTRSQAGTLRISATIVGLKAPSARANIGASAVGAVVGVPSIYAIKVGEVTVEAVFREALTNRIDAVAIDRSQGSRLLNARPWSTWADVKGTFNKWAKGIREAVDEAHGRT